MTQRKDSIREKLIIATIEIIEEEGFDAVTVRKIAKKASVNSAAINYYFGTKETLLEEALKHTLSHSFADIKEIFANDQSNSLSAVKSFLYYFLEGGFKNPGITKAHFFNPSMYNAYQEDFFYSWFNSVLEELLNKIKPLCPEKTEHQLKITIIQMISAVFFPVMLPAVFQNLEVDLAEEENQKAYIDHLLKQFLN